MSRFCRAAGSATIGDTYTTVTLSTNGSITGGERDFQQAGAPLAHFPPGLRRPHRYRLITDEGIAVGGGAFDTDTATGMMPGAHRVAGVLAFRRS
jgi:hypothetical protein